MRAVDRRTLPDFIRVFECLQILICKNFFTSARETLAPMNSCTNSCIQLMKLVHSDKRCLPAFGCVFRAQTKLSVTNAGVRNRSTTAYNAVKQYLDASSGTCGRLPVGLSPSDAMTNRCCNRIKTAIYYACIYEYIYE